MMKAVPLTAREIAQRGQRLYDQSARHFLEPAHNGEIAVINLDSGEYELDADHLTAIKRARARWPEAVFYSVRVGFPAMGHIGARSKGRPQPS